MLQAYFLVVIINDLLVTSKNIIFHMDQIALKRVNNVIK
jgi:hypothetical protein